MRKVLILCAALMACGVYVIWRHPNAALLGIALVAIAAILAIQACLIAIVTMVQPADRTHFQEPTHRKAWTLGDLFHAYGQFKIFLGRLVAWIATIYGIIDLNAYFIVLGTAGILLFRVWDRMIASDLAPSAHDDLVSNPADVMDSPTKTFRN